MVPPGSLPGHEIAPGFCHLMARKLINPAVNEYFFRIGVGRAISAGPKIQWVSNPTAPTAVGNF